MLSVLEQKDSKALKAHLDTYRTKGVVNYKETLTIPEYARIPALIQQKGGRNRVSMALAAAILSAFNNIEKATMDAEQIADLAEMIIDSSQEDDLAIEDVLLFLKEMLMGKMGKITHKLDYPLFFEMFEKYRDERYKVLESIRYEEHLNCKNMGHQSRSADEIILHREDDAPELLALMQTYYESKNE